jgi:MoaA/NifB/PqqE/SkfB family radical SAM enzyme
MPLFAPIGRRAAPDKTRYLLKEGKKVNLTEYLSSAIEQLIKDFLKSSRGNPAQMNFILKFVKSQRAAAKKRLEREKQGVHIPPIMIASISSRCNLSCKGCYARADFCFDGAGAEELPASEWGRIFKEAAQSGVSFILLSGGEPLLRRDVLEAAALVSNVVFPVFTNGTISDGGWLEFLGRCRNIVPVISVEGCQNHTDERRGEGTFEKVLETIGKLNERGILFGVSITVTAENLDFVTGGEFIDFLQKEGCGLVFYVEYVPVDALTKSLALTQSERQVLEDRQDGLRKRYPGVVFISFPGDEKYMGGCLAAGRGFLHVNPSGGAEPCPFSPFSDRNLRQSSFEEALKSPLFKKLYDEGLLTGEHDGGCVLFEKRNRVKRLLARAEES